MSADASDPFELRRFVDAQSGIYETAVAELRAGCKQTHWMWFVFPQVEGLGSSAMTRRYAIRSREEARAYLEHPLLGARLRECAAALLQVTGKSAEQIVGYPDFLKLRSSMTLFAGVAEADSPFGAVLDRYFSGEQDEFTHKFLTVSEIR